jgi:hypothetical protein
MLRATLIIFTAMFSVIILKMKLFRHHYLSLILIVIGLVLVGLSQVLYPSPTSKEEVEGANVASGMIVGVIVLIIGQVLGALSYIFEEKFLSEYADVHPLIVVGWEGIWGTLILVLMLLSMQFIPCSSESLCSVRPDGTGVIEDSYSAILELGSSTAQIVFTIALIPLAGFYNTAGTSVTAYGSAAARCTIEQLRNLFVWIYFMIFTVNGERIEKFTTIQLMGFVVLFFGILIFNEIIILPVFKMQDKTRYERIGSPYQSPSARRRTLMEANEGKIEVEFVEEEETGMGGSHKSGKFGESHQPA